MLVEERRNQLLELVRAKRFASLPELVEQLDVSESTVRRDLEYLEEQGSAKRIHGGVLYAGDSPKIPHFEQQPARWAEKRMVERDQGLARGELEGQIVGLFGPVRAEMIAVTEVTRAASEGQRGLANEVAQFGILMIDAWSTRNDEVVCPICGQVFEPRSAAHRYCSDQCARQAAKERNRDVQRRRRARPTKVRG